MAPPLPSRSSKLQNVESKMQPEKTDSTKIISKKKRPPIVPFDDELLSRIEQTPKLACGIHKLEQWIVLDKFLCLSLVCIKSHHQFIRSSEYKELYPNHPADPSVFIPDDGGDDSDSCHDLCLRNRRRKKRKIPWRKKLKQQKSTSERDLLAVHNPNETKYLRMARHYGRLFITLSQKHCIRVCKEVKRHFCKQCCVPWIVDVSCLVRCKWWREKWRIVYNCVECGWKRRFIINDQER